MTSHLNSHGTTDIKPEMLSGVQTGNGTPHGKYNVRGIAHARTNRKDDIFMQRRLLQSFTYILEWGRGTCTLTKHTWRWTYSALRHFFAAAWQNWDLRSSKECPREMLNERNYHKLTIYDCPLRASTFT